jgi:succinate-acetate transporter protein
LKRQQSAENEGNAEKMDTQRRLERIRTASSLVGLALEFALLGILILAKGDSEGISMAGGFIGIFLGATFLMSAFAFVRSVPVE